MKRCLEGIAVLSLMLLLSFSAGCLGQSGGNEPRGHAPGALENTMGIRSFQALVNGSDVVVQLMHSDRSAHAGTARIVIHDPSGSPVQSSEIDVRAGDYLDTGICTPEYCGIEKIFQKNLQVEVDGRGYTAALDFTYGDGETHAASAEIFFPEDL